MKIISRIFGFILQGIGLLISAPALLLLGLGGWFTNLGDTLRLNSETNV